MKLWLQGSNIEIYSTHNEEHFVAAERFIKTLKTKTTKNVVDNVNSNVVNKYNSAY